MNDRDLTELLHDAVADVEPARDLDEVHERAGRRTHWVPVTLAAALATVLALTGTVWLVQREGDASPAAAPAGATVVAYAVVDTPAGPRLTADPRRVPAGDDPVQAAVEQTLLVGPNAPGLRPVFFDEAPEGAARVSATGSSGAVTVDLELGATVDLRDAPKDVPLLGQAVAWTVATALDDSVVQVRMTSGGRTDSTVPGAGAPLLVDPAALAPVTVESVGDGDTVSSPFTVSGRASAFEGTVVWRLLDGDAVVREGFATAAESGTPSPYSFEVEAPPGSYTLEVAETDPSDGEGNAAYADTRRVTVE